METTSPLIPSNPKRREFNTNVRLFRPSISLSRLTRNISSPLPKNPKRNKSSNNKKNNNVRLPLQPHHRPHNPPLHRHDHELVRHPCHQQHHIPINIPIFQLLLNINNPLLKHHHATMLRLGHGARHRRLRVVLLPRRHGEEFGTVQRGFRGLFEAGGEG